MRQFCESNNFFEILFFTFFDSIFLNFSGISENGNSNMFDISVFENFPEIPKPKNYSLTPKYKHAEYFRDFPVYFLFH